jgi:signal transduction histidine kinase
MTRLGIAKSGKSLGLGEGYAGLRPSDLSYRVRRGALTAVAALALIAGLAATAAAVKGVAQHGVDTEAVGGTVLAVSPTGYAWKDGIRPGQAVRVLVASDEGGWHIQTTDASGDHVSDAALAERTLRASAPAGLVATVFGGLALVFLRTHRRWAVVAASISLLAASLPLRYEGDPVASTLVMGAAFAIPVGSLAGRFRGLARWIGVGLIVGVILAWAALRTTGATGGNEPDDLWGYVAYWPAAALVIERSLVPIMTGQSVGLLRPRIADVGLILAAVAVAVVASVVLEIPPLAIVVVVALLITVVPAARNRLGRPIEDVLFADVREQAAAEATERERARLARDLHDVPLQELVAVIRRLEILPGAEAESEDLRALAGHLRNVATELRPPVLDDLGLPAALDYLAEETSTSTLPVTAKIQDDTGFGEERRPPTDVELAMYRIAAEAVGNAIRHSGGSAIGIEAAVAPGKVELTVSDDGAGLAAGKARDAARRKRLGLASMRRRAEAIDAELSIDGTSNGTRVRVVWQA